MAKRKISISEKNSKFQKLSAAEKRVAIAKDVLLQIEAEKYGSLQLYMWASTPEMEELIDQAEELSMSICEDCGKEAELRTENPRWFRTLCDPCEEEYQKKRYSK